MALKDIFKRKKKDKELRVEKPKLKAERVEKVEDSLPKVSKEIKAGSSFRILKSPHITEKAASLAERNQYVFEVFKNANKNEIKKSVEGLFGVNVLRVRIVNIPKKPRRIGRQSGYKSGYKKAIVKIKEGQKIEILPR